MSDKSIIYRGEKQKAEEIIKKTDNCTTMHIITDDGDRSIAGYLTQDAKNIRDEVCIMQGRLEILCKGLDKSSEKKAGKVTITATAKDGSRKKATIKITVKK